MRNRDDRPWREHHPHVPREFDQGARRAGFRQRGAHENDDATYGHAPRWPAPDGAGPPPPAGADAGGPQPGPGRGGFARQRLGPPQVLARAHPERIARDGGGWLGAEATAASSGYLDYASEALFGAHFEDGDWPRTYRRGENGSKARGGRPDQGPGAQGRRHGDERLLDAINRRLAEDDYLDARQLSVSVADGVVRLDGTVAQRWMKHHAGHLVARCFGVEDVDNRLRIEPSDD